MSQVGWDHHYEDNFDLDPDSPEANIGSRLLLFRIIVVAIFTALLYRVFFIQQTEGESLQQAADNRRLATITTDAPRGSIFDRYGQPLAINEASFSITITPAFIPTDETERLAIFERLSLLTGVPVENEAQQQQLFDNANPTLVGTYSRLAALYGESLGDTLDDSEVVPRLPDSLEFIYQRDLFKQFLPTPVLTGAPYELALAVQQESAFLPGVQVIPDSKRVYPNGEESAHIIGFTGPLPNQSYVTERGYEPDDRVGLAGIESFLEETLAGTKGFEDIEVDVTGRRLRTFGDPVPPEPGLNLHLTIDVDLQSKAYEILYDWMEQRRQRIDLITGQPEDIEIELGVLVAVDPNTGEVLAMANVPTYDNNRFVEDPKLLPVEYFLRLARDEYEPLFNKAIGGQYPPGSVFKIVTAAAAMQEGIISPERSLDAPGTINIRNRFAPNDPGRAQEFICWISLVGGEHESMDMFEAMSNSCDIYFYKVMGGFNQEDSEGEIEVVPRMGIDVMKTYAEQFGFNQIQGIELPGEAPGLIPSTQWKLQNRGAPWSTGDDYNASIGQGDVLATPLQVAQMAAVVANGGFLYRPTILHEITDNDGNVVQEFQPDVLGIIDVDQRYIDVIAEGMRLTNEDEFGTAAKVEWLSESRGVRVAGKTGTAEFCDNIAIEKGWCFGEDGLLPILPTHSWYVGYAPYENPEIVVVGFIYNGGEGSEWAAPATRDLMDYFFELKDLRNPQPEEEEVPEGEEEVPLEGDEVQAGLGRVGATTR